MSFYFSARKLIDDNIRRTVRTKFLNHHVDGGKSDRPARLLLRSHRLKKIRGCGIDKSTYSSDLDKTPGQQR